MDLRNIRLEEIGKKKITIGKVAENLRTCIGFDCADIFAEYPDAVPALTVINPKGISYPAIVQRSGSSVLWEIRDSDLTAAGTGEIQLSFIQGEVIAKRYTGRIEVIRSIQSTGEAPDPITEWETEADAKLAEVAQALEDIPQAIDDALEAAKESGEFDGPPGQDGAPGRDGQDGAPGQDGTDGEDGVSPTVTVTDITGGHRVVITDAEGDHQFDVMDGTTPVQKDWELIRHIETTQDLTEVMIDTDQYGEGFELKRMLVVFQCGQSTTGARDAFYCTIKGNNESGTGKTTSSPSLTYATATSAMCAQIDAETHGIAPITVRSVVGSSEGNTQNLQAMPKIFALDVITAFRIYQSGSTKSLIPSGAIIDMYGIRA